MLGIIEAVTHISTEQRFSDRSLSPSPSHGLINTDFPHSTYRGQPYLSLNRRESAASRTYNDISMLSPSERGEATPERGRSPVRNGRGRTMREASPNSMEGRESRQRGYTEVSVHVPSQHRERTLLADEFETPRVKSPSGNKGDTPLVNGHSPNTVKKRPTVPAEEYDITTLTIPKAKQSLGQ